MQRYTESLAALSNALNLMIEEGDTLLVAAIAHPLHLAETRLHEQRTTIIAARMAPATYHRPI